ncbi:MAG: pyridoxal-phosphate dependent enzyme [Deltaproteobacteria bacterium]|nr:pyridoxal-phosphate dependent enzyme [Deltaproteobacteria bacterium]
MARPRNRSRNNNRRPQRQRGGNNWRRPQERIKEYLDENENPSEVEEKISSSAPASSYHVNSIAEVSVEYFPALFTRFPELSDRLAWVSLRGADKPSLPKLLVRSKHLFGSNYAFMKQEELDFHLLPENKARKLEFIIGDALRRNRKKLVSSGYVGSPHCLAIAKAAKELNMKAELILKRCPLDADALLRTSAMQALGANVKFRATERWFNFTFFWQKFFAKIFRHEIIPVSGLSTKGVFGYVSSMVELKSQIEEGVLPAPDYLFVNVTTGATLIGMEIGKRLAGLDSMKIIGLQTSHEMLSSKEELASLANQSVELMNRFLSHPLNVSFTGNEFHIEKNYEFGGHGHLPSEVRRWMDRFLEIEPIELDSNCTAKALYGMSDFISRNKIENKVTLFWNTHSPFRKGDLPKNFSYSKIGYRLKRWVREDQKTGRLIEVGRV